MAEIILIGQDNVQLDKSLAKEIRHKWDNNEFAPDDKIPIGEDRIKAKDIRSFRINEETPEEEDPKDLPTEQIKEILTAIKTEIIRIHMSYACCLQLSFY